MSIEGALYSRVVGQVTQLGQRFHPIKLPEKSIYPSATYQRMGGRSVQAHPQGDTPPPGTAAFASFQITVLAETRREALAVLELVRASIEAQRWTADGTSITSCWMVDSFDLDQDSLARIEGVAHVYDIMHS